MPTVSLKKITITVEDLVTGGTERLVIHRAKDLNLQKVWDEVDGDKITMSVTTIPDPVTQELYRVETSDA